MVTERIDNFETQRMALTEGKILSLFRRIRETEEYQKLKVEERVRLEEAYYNAKSPEHFEGEACKILEKATKKEAE